ncbi:hypothetical protein [Photobacterium leiognathi]|uniref:hypothetical protein n=1 Tax=Photobacterium leiognathi TaxID=553611 RepID=UPI002736336B|nr:hypothetical protein [Photobacterium leiognathi]
MKKIILSLVLASSTLTGCSMMPKSDIANTDFTKMDCEQIKAVFDEYDSTMEMVNTGGSLLSAFGAGAVTSSATTVAESAHQQALLIARPIVKIKHCNFTI